MDYVFLKRPGTQQVREIGTLYEAAGWWNRASDDPNGIRKVVDGSHCFMGALDDTTVVGMARAISDGVSDAYIQDVVVLPAYRKRGVARELIRRIVSHLQLSGIDWIGLVAERGTHKLYEDLGFEPIPNSKALVLKG